MHTIEHKTDEEKLRFVSILMQNISDAVIGTDTRENNYRILSWNKGAEKLYGWKPEEVVGKSAVEIVRSEMTDDQRKLSQEQLSMTGYWEGEVIQYNRHDQPLHIMASVSIVRDDNGRELGTVAVNRDITEKNRADLTEKIRQSEELKKLAETDVQKNNFIAMASHELKTPITSIKGYVQLLLEAIENQTDEKPVSPLLMRSSLKSVDKQVSRLTRLVSELLDLSKIERGALELKKEQFSLNELAIETVEDILYTNTTHEIILFHDYSATVTADKDRIGQVMINFLTNAIKYSPASKKINVRVHKTRDGEAAFSVQDFGIGIDKGEQQLIFDRFYRASGQHEQTYPGFGIGLFIANEFIQKHGGRLDLESEKDKGSVFTFTLPI